MRADIIPVLARAAGVDLVSAGKAFERARGAALRATDGRDDSRTFLLTLEAFRAAIPFDYSAIDMTEKRDASPSQSTDKPA